MQVVVDDDEVATLIVLFFFWAPPSWQPISRPGNWDWGCCRTREGTRGHGGPRSAISLFLTSPHQPSKPSIDRWSADDGGRDWNPKASRKRGNQNLVRGNQGIIRGPWSDAALESG